MSVASFFNRLVLGPRRAEERRVARIMRSADREVMTQIYIPAFAAAGGRILWIGCRAYTAAYPDMLENEGAQVWTTDIDADAERWGRSGGHRTGDVKTVDRLFEDLVFDAVLCNGVLGFGVDTPADQKRALAAIAAVLRPGGCLLLGWNADRIADPVAAGITTDHYQPAPIAGLPSRVPVHGVTHVYDSLVRRA